MIQHPLTRSCQTLPSMSWPTRHPCIFLILIIFWENLNEFFLKIDHIWVIYVMYYYNFQCSQYWVLWDLLMSYWKIYTCVIRFQHPQHQCPPPSTWQTTRGHTCSQSSWSWGASRGGSVSTAGRWRSCSSTRTRVWVWDCSTPVTWPLLSQCPRAWCSPLLNTLETMWRSATNTRTSRNKHFFYVNWFGWLIVDFNRWMNHFYMFVFVLILNSMIS